MYWVSLLGDLSLSTCVYLFTSFFIINVFAADCDFDNTVYAQGLFIESYEDQPAGTFLHHLVVDGDETTDIQLELEDNTYTVNSLDYIELGGKTIAWKASYDVDVSPYQDDFKFKVHCYQPQGSTSPTKTLNVILALYDANDNDPYFLNGPYYTDVNELTPLGFVIYSDILADDEDLKSDRTKLTYSMRGPGAGNVKFKSVNTPEVILIKELDFETNPFYNVTLIVMDAGTPQRTGTTYLYINVIDGEDQNPVFTSISYTATVYEEHSMLPLNVTPAIHAYDPDTLNESIVYSFANKDDLLDDTVQELGVFKINRTTGEIRVLYNIDREEKEDCTLVVVRAAQADKPKSRYTFVPVQVLVLDVNDNAPEMLQNVYNANLVKGAPPGTIVAIVEAVDRDEGDNAVIEFVLDDEFFEIETKAVGSIQLGRLIVKDVSGLPVEAGQEYYTVNVYAQESLTAEKFSSDTATVNINIENAITQCCTTSESYLEIVTAVLASIIVLLIICIIAYCIYRKRCAKALKVDVQHNSESSLCYKDSRHDDGKHGDCGHDDGGHDDGGHGDDKNNIHKDSNRRYSDQEKGALAIEKLSQMDTSHVNNGRDGRIYSDSKQKDCDQEQCLKSVDNLSHNDGMHDDSRHGDSGHGDSNRRVSHQDQKLLWAAKLSQTSIEKKTPDIINHYVPAGDNNETENGFIQERKVQDDDLVCESLSEDEDSEKSEIEYLHDKAK